MPRKSSLTPSLIKSFTKRVNAGDTAEQLAKRFKKSGATVALWKKKLNLTRANGASGKVSQALQMDMRKLKPKKLSIAQLRKEHQQLKLLLAEYLLERMKKG